VRIAVAGATGLIGRSVMAALHEAAHHAVAISRSHGIDAYTGVGLEAALEGVDAVIDCLNGPSAGGADPLDFFGTTTANLLAAERRTGVRHHVLLSVVGIDRGQRVLHYAGKREQERRVVGGPVPWTVVRSSSSPAPPPTWGDFWSRWLPKSPCSRRWRSQGRRPRTSWTWRGARSRRVDGGSGSSRPWRGSFGVDMAGEVLLPGAGARLTPTSFEDWLAAGAS
jgi:hypothetical protein